MLSFGLGAALLLLGGLMLGGFVGVVAAHNVKAARDRRQGKSDKKIEAIKAKKRLEEVSVELEAMRKGM